MKPFWRNLVAVTVAVVVINISSPLAIKLLQSIGMPPEHVFFSGIAIAMVLGGLANLLTLKLVPLTPKPVGP